MAGEPLGPQATNASRVYKLTLSGARGASLAGHFDNTETFTARIWPGESYASAATLTAAWESDPTAAASPVILLTVDTDDITDFTPGVYQVEVLIDPDELAYRGTIQITAAPGATAAPRTYCDLADMEAECSWIGTIENLERSRATNFLKERVQAAECSERNAMARYNRTIAEQGRRHAPVVTVEAITITTGIDAGPGWGESTIPDTTVRDAESDFADTLASVGLMVDYPADSKQLRRYNALMALHYALDDQMGNAPGGGETQLQTLGMKYRRRALEVLQSLVFRVSVETDEEGENYGVPDYQLVP